MFTKYGGQDAVLVGRAMQGDRDAFGELVTAYASVVYGVALAHLHNRADAEDLSQDAFLQAYRSLGALRAPAKFGPWLVTLTKNLCRTALVRRGRIAVLSENARIPSEPTAPQPEQEELHAILLREMGVLDDVSRESIMLHYFAHKTIPETAVLLGLSKAATAKRVQRARQVLGERLLEVAGDAIQREDAPQQRARRVMAAIATGPVAARPLAGAPAGAGGLTIAKALRGALTSTPIAIGIATALAVVAGLAYWSARQNIASEANVAASSVHAVTAAVVTPNEPAKVPEAPAKPAAASGASEAPKAQPLEMGEIADPDKYCAVSGRTVSEAGEPIAGAEVTLACFATPLHVYRNGAVESFKWAMDRNHQYHAVSDADGRFSIKGIQYLGYVQTTAQVKGLWLGGKNFELTEGAQKTDLDIVLQTFVQTVHGRVLSMSGAPVADAAIVPLDSPWSLSYTDTHGEFSLLCEKNGSTLQVYSPRCGLATFRDLREKLGTFLELRFSGTATLRGRVTLPGGTPAAGANIQLRGSADMGGGGTQSDILNDSVAADANGLYDVSGIDIGLTYEADVYDTEKKLRMHKTLGYLPANQVTTWDIHIPAPMVVRGTVRGSQSHLPITTPRTLLVTVVQAGEEIASEGGCPGTIPNGVYGITVPGEPGRYLVVPTYLSYSFKGFESYGREVTLAEGAVQTVDLELPDPFEMSVRVVDEQGAPAKGITVGQRGAGVSGAIGKTDDDGRFRFCGFMPVMSTSTGVAPLSKLWLELLGPGRFAEESEHRSGSPGQVFPEETITLYPAGEATGCVLAEDGTPVVNQKLVISAEYGDVRRTLEAPTDSKGRFRLKVPATTLTLDAASNPSGLPGSIHIAGLQCVAGQTLDLGNLVLVTSDPSK